MFLLRSTLWVELFWVAMPSSLKILICRNGNDLIIDTMHDDWELFVSLFYISSLHHEYAIKVYEGHSMIFVLSCSSFVYWILKESTKLFLNAFETCHSFSRLKNTNDLKDSNLNFDKIFLKLNLDNFSLRDRDNQGKR